MSFTNFLESSSIHGLAHIAHAQKFAKVLWIFIVVSGFIGAGTLIHQSFKSWSESPIITNIETLPISEISIPKV